VEKLNVGVIGRGGIAVMRQSPALRKALEF